MRLMACGECGFFDPEGRGGTCRCQPGKSARPTSRHRSERAPVRHSDDDIILLVTEDGSDIEIVDEEESFELPLGMAATAVALQAEARRR